MTYFDLDTFDLPEDEIPLPERRKLYPRDKSTILFVYGTMMPGQRNEDRLAVPGASLIGPAVTVDRYTMGAKLTSSGYYAPILFPHGRYRVCGYIVEVSPQVLDEIDMCEGHPFVYRRVRSTIDTPPYTVELYLYGVSSDSPMLSPHDVSDFVKKTNDMVWFDGGL